MLIDGEQWKVADVSHKAELQRIVLLPKPGIVNAGSNFCPERVVRESVRSGINFTWCPQT